MTKFKITSAGRYFVVAIIGFSVDFLIYSSLVFIGYGIFIANFFGFLTGMTLNLLLIRKFVFKTPKYEIRRDLLLTIFLNGLLFVIGTIILWILVDLLTYNEYFSKIASNTLTFILNFITRVLLF